MLEARRAPLDIYESFHGSRDASDVIVRPGRKDYTWSQRGVLTDNDVSALSSDQFAPGANVNS